jgi:fatty-acyl-CoA synthase
VREVNADRIAVADGQVRLTWAQFRARSRRLASALRAGGLQRGDRGAFLALNSEPLLLAHFAVPQAGGVLVAINTRLSTEEVAYIVEHSGSRTLFHSPELTASVGAVDPAIERVSLNSSFEALLRANGNSRLSVDVDGACIDNVLLAWIRGVEPQLQRASVVTLEWI